MRRLFIITFAVAVAMWAVPLHAQSAEAFKARLAAPAVSETGATAKVTVTEQPDVSRALAGAPRSGSSLRIDGYRVCIFFDNGESGRAGAFAAKSLFESTYPGIKAQVVYEAPYFRTKVGSCLTIEEAIILKGKVSGTFPKAITTSERLSITDILN